MATIKEVAALSNTSVSTASIVLRGDGDERKISKTIQDHVLRAAKELGYQPNTSAKKLREKKTAAFLSLSSGQMTFVFLWQSVLCEAYKMPFAALTNKLSFRFFVPE